MKNMLDPQIYRQNCSQRKLQWKIILKYKLHCGLLMSCRMRIEPAYWLAMSL